MSVAQRIAAPTRLMTAEEYLSGPEDEFKSELIYGELVMSPSARDWHQDLQLVLAYLLRLWVRAFDLGWVWHALDMVLDTAKHLVYRPDVLFLAKKHAKRRSRDRVFGPADLGVEILSPSVRSRILQRKFADYERYGVAWYWIIDVNRKRIEENQLVNGVYVCRQEIEGDEWFEPGVFPGLEFRLAGLIEGDLKSAVKGKAKKLV